MTPEQKERYITLLNSLWGCPFECEMGCIALEWMVENDQWFKCKEHLIEEAAEAIEKLLYELRLCRDELCLQCGDYKLAHKGACDGCRWKVLLADNP